MLLALLGAMDKSIALSSDKNTPFLTHDPPLFAKSLEKPTPGPGAKYEVDEKDISLSTSGTRVNSPDASIHDGKEGHDIEKTEVDLGGIDIYDPNRPRFKLSQRL